MTIGTIIAQVSAMAHSLRSNLRVCVLPLLFALSACGGSEEPNANDGTGGTGQAGSSGSAGNTGGTAGSTGGHAGSTGGFAGSTAGTAGTSGSTGGSAGQADCSHTCGAVRPPTWQRDRQPRSAVTDGTLAVAHVDTVSLFDASLSGNLSPLGSVDVPGYPTALYAREQTVLAVFVPTELGSHTPTLTAIDISTPTAPTVVATLSLPGAWDGYGELVTASSPSDLRGFAASYDGTTFWTVDLHDVTSPALANDLSFDGRMLGYMRGSWAFARDDGTLWVFDPSTAADASAAAPVSGTLRDPEVEGDELFVHDGGSVFAWDFSNPGSPGLQGKVDVPLGCAESLLTHRYIGGDGVGFIGRDVLVEESSGGMCDGLGFRWANRAVGLDLSDPNSPKLGTELALPVQVSDAALVDGGLLLYGAETGDSARAVLLRFDDPDAVEIVSSVSFAEPSYSSRSMRLVADSGLALFFAEEGKTALVDVDESGLTLRGSISTDGEVVDAHIVEGSLVVYTDWEVASFDITDKDAPVELAREMVMQH